MQVMTVHPPLAVIPDWGPSQTFISKQGGYKYVTDEYAALLATTWNKDLEEEREKSSDIVFDNILLNHRLDDQDPRYIRKSFRRDPKSRTEFLVKRTGRYRGKYRNDRRHHGRRGIKKRRMDIWNSGSNSFVSHALFNILRSSYLSCNIVCPILYPH